MDSDRPRCRGATLLAILLALAATGVSQAENCEPQLLGEATLTVTPDGGIYVPVRIHGHDAWFRLRLGGGLPLLYEAAVEPLGLTRQPLMNSSPLRYGPTPMTHYAKLTDTHIGTFHLADRPVVILPQPDVGAPDLLEGKPVAGTMGSTLVRYVDAELHLAARQLKLFKPFKCRSRSPVYWGAPAAELPMRFDNADTLSFTLELDGRKIEASMLEGGGPSTIDVDVTREFFGFDDTSPGVEVADDRAGGGVFHAMSLTGRGLDIRNARVQLRPGSTICKLSGRAPVTGAIAYSSNCVNRMPFNLGTDLLSQMRIYISKERGKIFVSVVDAQATSPSGDAVVVPGR